MCVARMIRSEPVAPMISPGRTKVRPALVLDPSGRASHDCALVGLGREKKLGEGEPIPRRALDVHAVEGQPADHRARVAMQKLSRDDLFVDTLLQVREADEFAPVVTLCVERVA